MDRDAIGEQVSRILRSQCFADKIQLAKLLRLLFENMDFQAALRPNRVIKELWPEEARTKGSADVATEMNRLRRAVERYYREEGQADPIAISFPRRSAPGQDSLKERRWIAAEPRGTPEISAPLPAPPLAAIPSDPPIPFPIPAPQPTPVPRVKIRKRLLILAATVAVGVLAYIGARVFPVDDQPQAGRIDNSALVIVNAKGVELWRKSFPDGLRGDYYNPEQAAEEANNVPEVPVNRNYLWIVDLEGNGHKSVLFLYQPATDPKLHSTTLICYSDRGNEKWRWSPGRNLPELDSVPAIYITMNMEVLKAPPGQPRRIVVMSRHFMYYPTQIAIVSAAGKTLSEYWHSGHLWQLVLGTLGDDRRESIFAFGISNGYRQATLLVLDPDQLGGASSEPARPDLQIHGMGEAHERFRLLFPRSDLNQALYLYNTGIDVIVDARRVQFGVKECWLTKPRGCTIVYDFDQNFQLLSASAEDTFLDAHREFYSKRKDNHPYSAQEEAQFQKVRCLVGCKSEYAPVQIN
jgi:hypothetical protein